jgi:DnaK suppressor protein
MINETTILAQPDSAYMSAEQLGFFKRLLLTKHSELAARIRDREKSLTEVEQVADAADAGSIEEARHITMGVLMRERAEIKAVDQALARIDDESYGWCETGEPIGLRRLLFNPTVALCVEAQSRLEQAGRHQRAIAA